MLKKWLLLAAIIAISFLGFFYDSLLSRGIRLYVDKKSAEMEMPLSYSKVEYAPHTLIFFDVEAIVEGGLIKANRLVLNHELSLFSRHIDLNIYLDNPHIGIDQDQVLLEKILNSQNGASFFTSSGQISCSNGCFSKNKENLFFDVNHSWVTEELGNYCHNGSYFLNLDEESASSSLHVSFQARSSFNIALQANLHNVKAEKLADALKSFVPELATWHFKEGMLDGEFEFALKDAQFVHGRGELVISDLQVEERNLGLMGSLKKAIFRTDAKTQHASLDLIEGGLLSFKDSETYASFRNFEGRLTITEADRLEMDLTGLWDDEKTPLHTELTGHLHIAKRPDLFMKISLSNPSLEKESTFISVAAKQLGGNYTEAQVALNGFGPKQFLFWQRAIENLFPGINPVAYHSGTLNALVDISFDKEQQLGAIKVENFEAANVSFAVKQWEAAFGADQLSGQLEMNFTDPHPKDTLNADINIANGQAVLTGLTNDFWQFNHIETKLSVRDGIVQKSSASVELAGLKGSAKVNSFSEAEILHFELQGKAVDLKPFLPEQVGMGLNSQMNQDLLTINAGVFKSTHGVNVLGEINVKNLQLASFPIKFSFDLERSPFEETASQSYEPAKEISSLIKEHSSPHLKALFNLDERMLQREAGFKGFVVRNGWFSISNLSLEKFLSPFLFPENNFSLTGKSNVEGRFDHLGISIRYDAHSLSLENDVLRIQVDQVTSQEGTYPAYHYFDFVSGKQFGKLPLENGSYLDKKTGLFFTDVHASVLFEEKMIHLLDVETFSNGLYLGGTINIDYNFPEWGYFSVELMVDTLHGKCSQVQHFFSHFDQPFFFVNLPLEGDVSLRNSGCRVGFHFKPQDLIITTQVDGNICDATLKDPSFDLSLQALSLNFSFDSLKGTAEVTDVQGALITGKVNAADEYSLYSHRIYFKNYENNEAEFDLWLKDQTRDLIRLTGTTASRFNENEEKEIVFQFDPQLTHFGESHPEEIALSLVGWTKIVKAKIDFSFQLSSLLHDLQKMGKSELLLESSHFFKKLGNLENAGGECAVSLNYDSSNAALNFQMHGSHVTLDKYHFNNVSLTGKKQSKTWLIDQLLIDQISIAAEFAKYEDVWKANFLGLRYGESLLVGMEGEYRDGDEYLKAHLNLIEANLAKLSEWPGLDALLEEYAPQGHLKGTGDLFLEFAENEPIRFDIDLNSSLQNFHIKDLHFKDLSPFLCHFSSDQGLSLSGISTGLIQEEEKEPIDLAVDNIQLNPNHGAYFFTGLHFNIPAMQLPSFVSNLTSNLPNLISAELEEAIKSIKKTSSLEGELNIQKYPTHTNLQLKLADGHYQFGQKEHFLRSFCLQLNPQMIEISTQYQFNQHLFSVLGKLEAPNFKKGEWILTDSMHQDPAIPPLVVNWHSDPQKGFIIDHAQGFFGGLKIELADSIVNPSDQSAIHLEGEVVTLSNQFRSLLDNELSEQVLKWQIGQGYRLRGAFDFARETHEEIRPLSFYGLLAGEDFYLKGYQFKNLTSQVVFTPQFIQLSDVTIMDPAVALYIDKIIVRKESLKSQLHIPLFSIKDLRPSLLTEAGKPQPTQVKPLVITELVINEIRGILGEESSFLGRGHLQFSNPVKKHLQNTIFAFPAEILTRIGLDLSVLTPVVGTVNYEIRDGKVLLTKFKDIYSHSRLSRFYLPNSRNLSYMDFEGNLNIQVKMKQHTLLFKLAELFTVTVQGNLKKPTYTLLRQKPLHRSEVITSTDFARE
ncbi:hypothetical protein PHSC3_000746 [Chlamydiales bacterium STE3]|nr:hypothetical protein PHSC3_000746 [Chlamydiales bacterium STE3]